MSTVYTSVKNFDSSWTKKWKVEDDGVIINSRSPFVCGRRRAQQNFKGPNLWENTGYLLLKISI